jgi:drug/metabolite transporter (DMT)-like permease
LIKQRSLQRPLIELTIAAILWGFGFVATVWSLPYLSPSAIIVYRFLTSFGVGASIFLFTRPPLAQFKNEFKFSIFAGLGLGLCLFLQTMGLQYTSATNSGFITTLYVIFVPFIARIFLKERLYLFHWFCVTLALIGTAFVVNLGNLDLNKGDLLTLACALIASCQIVYISSIASRSHHPFILNTLQSFWAGAPFLIALTFESGAEKWNLLSMDSRGWIGMLSLTFGSTVLAFYLQMKAQKQINTSLASLIYLLESPSSCLFAVLLLGERLQPPQVLGAVLIIGSCVLATWFESRKSVLV